MRKIADWTTRMAFADFLRRRREELSPEMVRRPSGQRRRTPGLRRDEVARLASMSTSYYEQLEQGRGPQPSNAILVGLARALRLDPDGQAYLYLLAGEAQPLSARPDDAVDPHILWVMRGLTLPACVTDDLGTIRAQNESHVSLFGLVTDPVGLGGNLFGNWFGPGRWRRSVLNAPEEQEVIGRNLVARLRVGVAERGYDAAAATLVADLRAVSADFGRMWDEHRVNTPSEPSLSILDDRVGRLDFDCVELTNARSRQRLCSMHAVAGTPTEQRMSRLAELSGDTVAPLLTGAEAGAGQGG
ncbi:helix-turn-helix domain-containing protein [Actinoplanes sp. NPDC049265]|uniref:helix-turn-helix domain-containing protein n=1 Tax=Actinoplanes sp. NPDC049265 TaxID=3363902 RepID=UPI003723958A